MQAWHLGIHYKDLTPGRHKEAEFSKQGYSLHHAGMALRKLTTQTKLQAGIRKQFSEQGYSLYHADRKPEKGRSTGLHILRLDSHMQHSRHCFTDLST